MHLEVRIGRGTPAHRSRCYGSVRAEGEDVGAASARLTVGADSGPVREHGPLAVPRVPLPLQPHAGHEALRRGDVLGELARVGIRPVLLVVAETLLLAALVLAALKVHLV